MPTPAISSLPKVDPNTTFVHINEVFYSIQGEGVRAGTANTFVRLSGCNLQCTKEAGPKSPGGFDCDTEFTSGTRMSLVELHRLIVQEITKGSGPSKPGWIIFTGGEPGLQLSAPICDYFHSLGFKLAVETNGSILLPHVGESHGVANEEDIDAILNSFCIDWITVSPKVAEHAIRQLWAHEVKYVRGASQGIPKTNVRAKHQLISPAFNGLGLDRDAMTTCLGLVKANPDWGISIQAHKFYGVR